MKLFASLLLLGSLCVAHAGAQTINAPQPNTMGVTGWSLAGALLAGRALDWASTQECLRRSYCKEAELPSTLAHSKVGLGAFEVGAASLEILSEYQLTRRGHRKLARAMASVNVGLSLTVDAHNYRAAK
jgi:hypothetical protein